MSIITKTYLFAVSGILACLSFSSCCDSESVKVSRTILAYMVSNSDVRLSNAFELNIQNMERAANQGALNDGNLIIYIDSDNADPYLLKIEKGQRKRLKTYPKQRSIDPEIMKGILCEVFSEYPAKSYGLIISSHGAGWIPSEAPYYNAPKKTIMYNQAGITPISYILETRWILKEEKNKMDINTLSSILESAPHFDFILFDACFMSNIESLYPLRERTSYIIAAPTEILLAGFPYNQVLKHLFKPSIDLSAACKEFYLFYSKHYQSFGSIALTRTSMLDPLAQIMYEIMVNNKNRSVNPYTTQKYDQLSNSIFFDLGDMARQLATTEQYDQLQQILNQAIVYKASTPKFGYTLIDPDRFSGISCYIPYNYYQDLNSAWALTEWGKRISE